MPYSHYNLLSALILLGVTIINLGILVGLFPNAIPAAETVQLIVLAAIELPLVLLIYRYSKRHSRQVSL
jgi:membrane protein implicated in regulation of membrane protease activity